MTMEFPKCCLSYILTFLRDASGNESSIALRISSILLPDVMRQLSVGRNAINSQRRPPAHRGKTVEKVIQLGSQKNINSKDISNGWISPLCQEWPSSSTWSYVS